MGGLITYGKFDIVAIMIFIMLAMGGYVHLFNPCPRNADIFPCGFRQIKVQGASLELLCFNVINSMVYRFAVVSNGRKSNSSHFVYIIEYTNKTKLIG